MNVLLSTFKKLFPKKVKYAELFTTFEKLKCINKDMVISYFNSNKIKIQKKERIKGLIVSLTSFPGRMYDIHYSLISILDQTIMPEKIIVWLGEEKFPDKIDDLPEILHELSKLGIDFIWRKDLRQYTKLVYSLIEFPNHVIVTADDDIYYRNDWLEKLYNEYSLDPGKNFIYAHRAHKIRVSEEGKIEPYSMWKKEISDGSSSIYNFLTGVGGVLYPPKSLYRDVTNYELYSTLTPNNDDIWFYFMGLINGYKVKAIEKGYPSSVFVNPQRELRLTNEPTLAMLNVVSNGNDEQFKKVADYYSVNYSELKDC